MRTRRPDPPNRVRLPRLSLADWAALGKAAEKLAQVAGALRTTNWAGSPLAQVLIRDAYEVVADLYNRGEKAALAHPRARGQRSLFDPPEGAPGGGNSEGG